MQKAIEILVMYKNRIQADLDAGLPTSINADVNAHFESCKKAINYLRFQTDEPRVPQNEEELSSFIKYTNEKGNSSIKKNLINWGKWRNQKAGTIGIKYKY